VRKNRAPGDRDHLVAGHLDARGLRQVQGQPCRVWTSNTERTTASPTWLEYHNLERPHLGIGGLSPINRVNNGAGQYT